MKIQSIVLALALVLPASVAVAPQAFVSQASAQEVLAQSYWGPPRGYGDRYAPPARRSCVRWCPSDMNPCDPPEFKVADGRCNGDRGNRR